jgi:hypothetical protein
MKLLQNDQIMRFFAVFVFAPILILKGIKYKDILIILFGFGLFTWDFYCILFRKPIKL